MFAYIFPLFAVPLSGLYCVGCLAWCWCLLRLFLIGTLAANWLGALLIGVFGGTLNRSAMAFALDYRLSRQLNHIFRFFSGDGGFDAGATLGYGFDGNLSACFRFVWFDGAGD